MDKMFAVVYETMDYGKFKKLEYNRDVTEQRKNKLMASLSIHEVLNPITVNKNFEIIDGQGRYEAKKEMGQPIYYVMDENATIDDCRRLNTYNTKWTDLDYIVSYAKSGNDNYKRLLSICQETDLSISTAIRFAGRSARRSSNQDLIRSGQLEFTEKDMETAFGVEKKAQEIIKALQFNGRINDAYRIAVKIMVEYDNFNYSSFLDNCAKYRKRYTQMARLEDQLAEFSEIYNMRKGSEKRLYFEDYMRNKGANVRTYDDMKVSSQLRKKNASTLEKAV